MSDNNEISALIRLLDDSDNEVFHHVHNKLLSFGPDIIPQLEQAWEADMDPVTHERIETVIQQIQFQALLQEYKIWLKSPGDLLYGAFLVAKYHYPEIVYEEVRKKADKVKQSIWIEFNAYQTAIEQIQIFNQVFYSNLGYSNVKEVNGFQHLCINHLLESKAGSAYTLGILYQSMANELNLAIYGVTLVQSYVLCFCKNLVLDFDKQNLESDVLFYINPMNKGSFFSRQDIITYLDKLEETKKREYFVPASNVTVVNTLLENLIEVHKNDVSVDRMKDLQTMLELSKH